MKAGNSNGQDRLASLRAAVEGGSHLLPIQGPIGVFIHHNTLNSFQHLPFEEAVLKASEVFGAEPYMREEQFREALNRGRIEPGDVAAVMKNEPDAPILPGRLRRNELRKVMLVAGVRRFDPATILWEMEEGGLLRRFRDDIGPDARKAYIGDRTEEQAVRGLFRACSNRMPYLAPPEPKAVTRPRDGLLREFGMDIDEVIHPFLIRLTGAFLDQGLACWPMPARENGFYRVVRDLYIHPGALSARHLEHLGKEFSRQFAGSLDAEGAILHCLDRLGIPETEWEQTLTAEMLALPGWAGLMLRLEQEPGLAPHEQVPCSLVDFLAVRLTLTVAAALSVTGSPDILRTVWRVFTEANVTEADRLMAVAQVFDVAQLLGLNERDISALNASVFYAFVSEIEAFADPERRRIWQLAYELRHERGILGPIGRHRASSPPEPWATRPVAQVMFCIDEREEAIRRHLEEMAPDVETLGAAGLFGIAVDYAGIDDAHGVPLCPVVVKTQHPVRECVPEAHAHLHQRRKVLRAFWASLARGSAISAKTLVRGALSTAALGIFSLFPLIAHVFSPRFYSRLTDALNRWILPEPRRELTLMRSDSESHLASENLLLRFSPEEKADRVASVLAPAGLITRFARIFVVLGHGSASLNNPHESAYDCGACGGRRGGPNGRLFAAMANRPEVRRILRDRGIMIPEDTWFVGGYHDTCSDGIELYNLEALPESHRGDLQAIRKLMDEARARGAHERARRFEAAPPGLTPAGALWHVQERSEHLAEPRPEYGHCTNAVAIIGRRETTRGLFFDRRAFLVSYDATVDPDDGNLSQLLGTAIPVCGGISLEYYFSFVDNERYGCGTKLPHNISGLVGVMNGYETDLKTGLPWQMVEIHEPVRILFVIETTPDRFLHAISGSALLQEFVNNRWIRVSTLDPDTGGIHVWRNGAFEAVDTLTAELPSAPTSIDWYRGRREHLQVARIGEWR